MYIIIAVVIGVLLFAAGVMDLKSKTISRRLILALAVASLAGALINVFVGKEFGVWEVVGGVLIGVCAIGLSMISREQIGRGDGLVIAAIGLMLGFRRCLFAVCMASIIMTLVSVIILILRKGNRNTRLPFIPALFAGYVMCMTAAG
ncbi:MAG: A24 family peptidase [Lachnospiraceae bacterium]|nr:A24 family peptidase [Lachnospiraceae bacterium]